MPDRQTRLVLPPTPSCPSRRPEASAETATNVDFQLAAFSTNGKANSTWPTPLLPDWHHIRALVMLADEEPAHLLLVPQQVIARFAVHLDQPFQEEIALTRVRPSVPAGLSVAFFPRA